MSLNNICSCFNKKMGNWECHRASNETVSISSRLVASSRETVSDHFFCLSRKKWVKNQNLVKNIIQNVDSYFLGLVSRLVS